MQDLVDFHRVLLLGAAGVGGHPRGKFDPVIFKAADDDVAVADIYCQNHFAFPFRYLAPSFNSTLPTAAVMSAATIASGMPLVAMTARMAL